MPGFETIASRTVLTGRSRAPRARRTPRGSPRRARPCAATRCAPRRCPRRGRTRRELLGELRADLVARPEEPSEVLHPLEVRDGDAAGVREDVRQDRDPALGEDLVRLERGRAVRALGDQPRAQPRRVVRRDLVLARREHEDVAVELEQLLVRDPLARRRSLRASRARARTRGARRRRGPLRVVDAARDVGDRDHGRAAARRAPSAAMPPTLPKPCTTQRCSASVQPSRSHARAITITTPAPVASWRKTEPPIEIGLPGHDLRHGVAALHRVRVHHPGHRLLVRRHVRRRDVLLRADDRQQLRREAPREPLELAERHARAGRSERRPSRRRTAGAGARTSTSSTSRARRTRRASPRGRSGCRPSSGRARSSAGRGSRGRRRGGRRPCAPGSRRSIARSGSAGARRHRPGRPRTGTAWSNCATAVR